MTRYLAFDEDNHVYLRECRILIGANLVLKRYQR